MGGRGSKSSMAGRSMSSMASQASINVGGTNYTLKSNDIVDQTVQYMNWLDKGTARIHALGVADNHDNYADSYMVEGGSLAYYTTRNAVQRVTNDQGNKKYVELSSIASLPPNQRQMVVNSVKKGIMEWFNKDSQTKAGIKAYKKMRKNYDPTTMMYKSL